VFVPGYNGLWLHLSVYTVRMPIKGSNTRALWRSHSYLIRVLFIVTLAVNNDEGFN